MSRTAEPLPRSPFSTGSNNGFSNGSRKVAILPSSSTSTTFSQPDSMDITPPASATMAPPRNGTPETDVDRDGPMLNGSANSDGIKSQADHMGAPNGTNGINGSGLGAAAAAAMASTQPPKVVQTAFIHKLYNMLEDQSIRHLISWSTSNESFVMSPSTDFSKVLAQYFKHTNISSFVRQLNMYGFHKVSDVFHTSQPESALWEFKHGNGNFKRGDLAGLREIKRRASRHALIHRDSFSSPHKPSVVSQPGTPAEPAPETGDPRLATIDHSLYDIHARLLRTEESNTALSSKCAALSDSLAKCYQWNSELVQIVLKLIPDHDSQIFRDLTGIHTKLNHQAETVRAIDDPHESLLSGRQPYFNNMTIDNPPLSPRQMPQDEHRRPSVPAIPPRASFFRPPPASISPRRFGSIGNAAHSPGYNRPAANNAQASTPGTQQHPLATVSETGYNLGRRHTSADIRDTAGWPPQQGQEGQPSQQGQNPSGSPFESPAPSNSHWPPSPAPRVLNPSDQHVRDVLAAYELGAPRRPPGSHLASREKSSPPPTFNGTENGWTSNSSKLAPRILDSAPQTRRSSMASNVHNLLNPTETAEREEEDGGSEDRKRKRVQ